MGRPDADQRPASSVSMRALDAPSHIVRIGSVDRPRQAWHPGRARSVGQHEPSRLVPGVRPPRGPPPRTTAPGPTTRSGARPGRSAGRRCRGAGCGTACPGSWPSAGRASGPTPARWPRGAEADDPDVEHGRRRGAEDPQHPVRDPHREGPERGRGRQRQRAGRRSRRAGCRGRRGSARRAPAAGRATANPARGSSRWCRTPRHTTRSKLPGDHGRVRRSARTTSDVGERRQVAGRRLDRARAVQGDQAVEMGGQEPRVPALAATGVEPDLARAATPCRGRGSTPRRIRRPRRGRRRRCSTRSRSSRRCVTSWRRAGPRHEMPR